MGSKVIIMLTLFVALTSGQKIYSGSCPSNITTQDNFQVDQYLGTWWEYEKYPFIFEIGGKCIRAEYGKASDGDVTVRNEQLFFKSKRSVKGTAKVVGDGKLTVTFDLGLISPSSPYWVLSTDYQNYAVVYSCNSKSLFHTKVIWILTRARVPSPEIVEAAYSAIKRQHLDTEPLTRTDNENCDSAAQ